MKTNSIIQRNLAALALLAFSTFNSQLSTAFAQGSLTPPGGPAPTMKSADQIEPRTIVNAVNTPGDADNLFIITNAGSYYLTTNLVGVNAKNGIEITANDVTLDLNGFALLGVSASKDGINIPDAQINITVRNGTISGWQYGFGVDSPSSANQVFERLNVSYGLAGIMVGSAVVRDCNCQNSEHDGISVGSGTVCDCNCQSNGTGIFVMSGTVSGCTANNNGNGIVINCGTVSGCNVYNNATEGIAVTADSKVIGNTCVGNGAQVTGPPAILICGSNNRVEDNHCAANGTIGIQVGNGSSDTNNIIIKNSVSGNGANNYVLPGAQIVGPIITNTVSGIITNSNPWANFSF